MVARRDGWGGTANSWALVLGDTFPPLYRPQQALGSTHCATRDMHPSCIPALDEDRTIVIES